MASRRREGSSSNSSSRFLERQAERRASEEARRAWRASGWFSRSRVWFSDLGQFAQIGLLALGVAGFFYTVVPLYEKALLDEEIARKQIELENLTGQLDKYYVRHRREVIRQLALSALPCTSLTDPVGQRRKMRDVLATDQIDRCLRTKLDEILDPSSHTVNLRPPDAEKFQRAIENVIAGLPAARAHALENYDHIPDEVRASESPALGEFSTELNAIFTKLERAGMPIVTSAERRRLLERNAISYRQSTLTIDFETRTLKNLRDSAEHIWPEDWPAAADGNTESTPPHDQGTLEGRP